MNTAEAADLIWSETRQGRYFPEALHGQLSLQDALAVQLAVLERKKAEGQTQAGWKVGLTSDRVRKRLGSEERPFGHIMAHRVFEAGTAVPSGEIINCALEPELW